MGRTYRKRKKRNIDSNKLKKCFQPIDYKKIRSLIQWLKDNGFERQKYLCPKLNPNLFPKTGRGLQCRSEKICCGDLLVSIPNHLLITRNTVFYESDLPLNSLKTKLNSIELLTAFLFWESNKYQKSHWFQYIQSLPNNFNELPYFWPLDEISDSIPDSLTIQLMSEFIKFEKSMKNFFSELNIYDKSDDEISLFKWCYSAVNTRCVYLDTDDCPNDCALAPFLDLLNHSNETKIKVLVNKINNCFEIYSLTEYKKYDEVFINYGNHNNRSLFINYGFCCESISDNNSIPISFRQLYDLFSIDSQLIRRFKSLSRIKFMNESDDCYWITSLGLDWKLDMFLKLISLNQWNEDSIIKQRIYSENIELLTEIEKKKYLNNKRVIIEKLLSEYSIEKINLFKNSCLKNLMFNEIEILSNILSEN